MLGESPFAASGNAERSYRFRKDESILERGLSQSPAVTRTSDYQLGMTEIDIGYQAVIRCQNSPFSDLGASEWFGTHSELLCSPQKPASCVDLFTSKAAKTTY